MCVCPCMYVYMCVETDNILINLFQNINIQTKSLVLKFNLVFEYFDVLIYCHMYVCVRVYVNRK